ncbi:MAG: DUF3015 domain-containing protein [Deltaproteobacteria bacterium]|jgi:hypothetical protein|nr:MAG: DUF3015 domain-containing protein [Deltaproteobacteria bacterium]
MKKLLVMVAALSLIVAGSAFAAGNTGCGLGTTIFKDTQNQSTLVQVVAVTTNGTFGNQTFGISSGTSECAQPAKVVQNERLNEFVQANLDELARDISAGKGETLSTVAELMGVPAGDRDAFNSKLQANFHQIFPSPGVEYAHVVDTIVSVSNQG